MTTDNCQEGERPQKPSDRIESAMLNQIDANLRATFEQQLGQSVSDDYFAMFKENVTGKLEFQIAMLSCYVAAIKVELDREAERRAKWEETVEVRLNGLTTRFAADPL